MTEIEPHLHPHINDTSFPFWIVDKFRALNINGLTIQGYGGAELTKTIEAGAIMYEIGKVDASIGLWFLIQNGIGMSVIDKLGNEEQKSRLLPSGINFDTHYCFGLTEPDYGSDASSLQTTARKVKDGYLLTGEKRWIGNSTFGDVLVWARNQS